MTRRCELTGKSVKSGNKVSNSNRKVGRVWRPNLGEAMLMSEALGLFKPVRLSKHALRTVDLAGGLDAYLLEWANPDVLSPRMKRLRAVLKKKKKKENNNQNPRKAEVAA